MKVFEGVIIKPFKAEDLLSLFALSNTVQEPLTFDEKPLQQMTMGDQQLMKKILQSFKADCKEDETIIATKFKRCQSV